MTASIHMEMCEEYTRRSMGFFRIALEPGRILPKPTIADAVGIGQ